MEFLLSDSERGSGHLSSTGDVDLICDDDLYSISSLEIEVRRNTVTTADIKTNTKTTPATGFLFKSLLHD